MSFLLYPCFYYIPSFKKNNKQVLIFGFFLIIFSLIVFTGLIIFNSQIENNYNHNKKNKPEAITLMFIEDFTVGGEEIDWSLFLLAWNRVQENFIYFDEIDKDKMNTAIMKTIENFIYDNQIDEKEINIAVIKTMIKELNCPFSRFQIAPYPQSFIREIGIKIEKREEKITIIATEKNSPAENKIIVGDQLISINNKDIKNLELREITKKLEGEAGTEVKLSILRLGYIEYFRIIRREIRELPPIPMPPTVEWKLKNNNIAYIQIFSFMDNLYFDFHSVVNEILKSPANKIILDLRNNPGGDMGIVKRVSEHFLRQGNIILIEKRPNEKIEHKSQKTGKLSEMKTVVLINTNSFSGAEIMAATLRDNRGVILIGEKSFGKASVQRIFHLKDRYSIIITTDTWLTPQEKSINIVGIKPDYFIVEPDQQLNKALELLDQKPLEFFNKK